MNEEVVAAKAGAKFLTYEEETKERIRTWHAQLKELVAQRDSAGVQWLKTAIDAELALAELKLKARQADWAKVMTWGPFVVPLLSAVGALAGVWIGAWLKGPC
jgi:hypothetical protein